MFLFVLFLSTGSVKRYAHDAMFIKILDDSNMRETIKKPESSFVLFHVDHVLLSDTAYMNYVKVAKKYKENASFYVVPASSGSDVARTYNVPGNPSLLHFSKGTKDGIHFGSFSEQSIDRFIYNWTKKSYQEIIFTGDVNETTVNQAIMEYVGSRPSVVVMFVDDLTMFGKCAIKESIELSPYFKFLLIRNQDAAKAINVRWPSLVFFRFEDSQRFVYTGESDPDEMFMWIQYSSVPSFTRLDIKGLFSVDGVATRSLIVLLDENNDDDMDNMYKTLGKKSSEDKNIRMFYGDYKHYRSIASLFNIKKFPATLYLNANYTHLQYRVSDGIVSDEIYREFINETIRYEMIDTPQSMYGILRPVTEFAFETILKVNPTFVLFSSKFCAKCKSFKFSVFEAARIIHRNNITVPWTEWDVTISTPSFQKEVDVGIPSLMFFPDANYSNAKVYSGPGNHLAVIEWVDNHMSGKINSVDIINKEIGGGIDEI